MLLKNKLDKIKTLLKNDNVLANLEERYCYSNDASNSRFESQIPDLVVFPETIKDVQNVVRYANEHDIPIIARGAGTNMVGACVCTQRGIILNFSKMNKILEINKTNLIARVEPGVVLGDLKTAVEELGLFYPPDPSNYKVSTIGGSIAQSSAGAMSFRYGTTKDYVLSLKVVTADGNLMTLGGETSKNAMGYHLAQLMVGSEGTLGIVVEATLKLIPKPAIKTAVLAYFNDIEAAINSMDKMLMNGIFPASVDFLDKKSMLTIEAFLPTGLKTENDYLLLIDVDGTELSVNQQKNELEKLLITSGATSVVLMKDEEDSERVWKARRSSYAAATRLAPDVVSDDIVVPRDKLALMIKKCHKIAEQYSLNLCLVGHVGDGNIHPQFVIDLDNEEQFRKYSVAKSEIYDYAISLGGTISAEHGIGLEKISYLENTIDSSALEYMKLIKKTFDPKNILNPGKIFRL